MKNFITLLLFIVVTITIQAQPKPAVKTGTPVVPGVPSKAKVRTNVTPDVHIFADLKKVIEGKTVIHFENALDVMGGTAVQNISADNIPTMFRIDHVHND